MSYTRYLTKNIKLSFFEENHIHYSKTCPYCVLHIESLKNISPIRRKILHSKFFYYYKLHNKKFSKFTHIYWALHKNQLNEMVNYNNVRQNYNSNKGKQL